MMNNGLLKKHFTYKNLYILVGLFIIGLFVYIAQYNHPSADDYCYTNDTLSLGFWQFQKHLYLTWTGRYISSVFLSSSPLLFHSISTYKVIAVVLILLLLYGTYFLIKAVFPQIKRSDKMVITLFLMVMYFSQMPSIAQGIYWAAGALTYQTGNIFSLFLFAFIYLLMKTKQRKYLISAVIFAFLIMGSNETVLVIVDFIVFSIFAYQCYTTKKIDKQLFVLLSFMFVFSVISIFAPGNSGRATQLPDKHKLSAIIWSLVATKKMLVNWLPLLLMLNILLFDYINKLEITKSRFFNVNPFLGLVILPFIVFLGFFPGYWELGHIPPGRALNVIYFFFVFGFVYFSLAAYYYYQSKGKSFIQISSFVKISIIFLLVILLKQNDKNIYVAFNDLKTERAYWYDIENFDRYRKIFDTKSDTIYLKYYHNRPKTLLFDDITEDPKHWRNSCYAKYWGKKAIIIKKEEKK